MNDRPNELSDGMVIAADVPGFSPDELVACGKCSKTNPPNRSNCLYCGSALTLPENVQSGVQVRPNDVEGWENGTNVVIDLSGSSSTADLITQAVRVDETALGFALDSQKPTPVLRTTAEDAAAALKRFAGLGVKAWVIEDVELRPTVPPHRVRAMEFGDGAIVFTHFNTSELRHVGHGSITAVIVGSISEDRWDATIKKSRKETKSLDESSSSSDHAVIDIYTTDEPLGFRISTNGFDFSCLGSDKKMLAVDNFRTLVEKIRATATGAAVDLDYPKFKKAIEFVWPLTRSIASKGIHRKGFGMALTKGESATNLEQFTKYSRLRSRIK